MGKDTISLVVGSNTNLFSPVVSGKITWKTERKPTPGKLTFQVLKDTDHPILPGMAVAFQYGGKKVFYGFVVSTKETADETISVTAYDQIFYLKKNTDSYAFSSKKASAILRMIAEDFSLQVGSIADTGYAIESLIEDDTALIDIIGDALDETLLNTGEMYVLYDRYGKLTLQNISKLRTNLLISVDTIQEYSYSNSLDGDVYNKIKLTYDNDSTGKREVYLAKDSSHINDWGVLQYNESLQTSTGAAEKAKKLLSLYNALEKTLEVTGAFGDLAARAGASVVAKMQFSGVSLSNYMLIETAEHTFFDGAHTMDLKLRGGDINA